MLCSSTASMLGLHSTIISTVMNYEQIIYQVNMQQISSLQLVTCGDLLFLSSGGFGLMVQRRREKKKRCHLEFVPPPKYSDQINWWETIIRHSLVQHLVDFQLVLCLFDHVSWEAEVQLVDGEGREALTKFDQHVVSQLHIILRWVFSWKQSQDN